MLLLPNPWFLASSELHIESLFSFQCIASLWLKLTGQKRINNGSAFIECFISRWLILSCSDAEKTCGLSGGVSVRRRQPQSQSTSIESNRLRRRLPFAVMSPFGGLPGWQTRWQSWAVRLWALLTDLLSPEMRFTSEHKRSATEKSFSPLSSAPPPPLKGSPSLSVIRRGGIKIKLASERKNR